MAGQIRIRIGATKDRSVDVVFADVEKRGKRAAQNIARDMRNALGGGRVSGTGGGVPTGSPAKSHEKQASQEMRRRLRLEMALDKANHRERLRLLQREGRERIQAAKRANREAARASFDERRAFARRTSHRTTRFLMPNAPLGSIAARGVNSFARGAGVEADLQSMVSRVRSAQDAALALSSKGFVKGASGEKGRRVAPQVLIDEARAMAKRHGVQGGAAGVLEGQFEFVEQRGNLAGSRRIFDALMQRSVATRSDPRAIGKLAAKVDSMLATQGEYATNDQLREKKVIEVVDNLMQQSKVGSIGMAEIAVEAPKISGLAAQFGGDVAENFKQLMAITQMAERGPASNPAVAATMAKNFAIQLSKNADKIKDIAGVDVYGADGKKKSPAQIAMDVISATEGGKRIAGEQLSQEQLLNKMLPNIRGNLALAELMNVFTGSGGGVEGRQAMEREFGKEMFGGNYKQLAEDYALAQTSMTVEAEKFNVALEEITEELAEELTPALKEAAPDIIKFIGAMADMAQWAVQNPWEAAWRAIELSILRAGLESSLRTVVERAIMSRVGTWAAPGTPGGAHAGAGAAGGTIMATGAGGKKPSKAAGIIAAAATIAFGFEAGYALGEAIAPYIFDSMLEAQKNAQNKAIQDDTEKVRTLETMEEKGPGGLSTGDREALKREAESLSHRIGRAEERQGWWDAPKAVDDMFSEWFGIKSKDQLGQEQTDEFKVEELKTRLDRVSELLGGELKVSVTNMPKGGGGEGVDSSGRVDSSSVVAPWGNMGRGY